MARGSMVEFCLTDRDAEAFPHCDGSHGLMRYALYDMPATLLNVAVVKKIDDWSPIAPRLVSQTVQPQ